MKKFLTILGSLVLTSSGVFSTIGCKNNPPIVNPNNDQNDKKNEETKIINKLNRFSQLNPLVINNDDFQAVSGDDAFDTLKTNFTEFGDSLTLTQTNFSKIEVVDNSANYGQLEVTATFKGEELVNPKTKDNNFVVEIATNDLKLANETIKKLDQNLTMVFSEMNLPIAGNNLPVKTILELIPQFGLFKNLPTVIPTKFDDSDVNWTKWQSFINLLTSLPIAGDLLKDGELNKVITQNHIAGTTITVKIKAKYLDILNSLAPDIIHFHNFIVEQRQQQKSQNLILLLIQYLFDTPRNINNDGFLDVNKDIDSNKGGKINFTTNLEHILHNLFDGWKNKSNEWSAARTPIEIVISVKVIFITTTIKIKYEQIPPRWYQITSGTEGIVDILPISYVKSFINQLFDYDLNSDLKLRVHIVKWDINFPIPLNNQIQSSIPTMLKIKGYSDEAIANNAIKLNGGDSILNIRINQMVSEN